MGYGNKGYSKVAVWALALGIINFMGLMFIAVIFLVR